MPFRDRSDAGRALARALVKYRQEKPVILALPRGGVPVAAEVADALGAPLDLILVRKLGVPMQPELAMGAVSNGADPVVVRNEDIIAMAGVSEAAFQAASARERAEIERRRQRYLGGRPRVEVKDRVVIVVDDGIATGATTRAALRAIRARRPRKLVLAVPVAPADTVSDLAVDADDIVCLESYAVFGAIGEFYANFRQLTDEDVIGILRRFSAAPPAVEP